MNFNQLLAVNEFTNLNDILERYLENPNNKKQIQQDYQNILLKVKSGNELVDVNQQIYEVIFNDDNYKFQEFPSNICLQFSTINHEFIDESHKIIVNLQLQNKEDNSQMAIILFMENNEKFSKEALQFENELVKLKKFQILLEKERNKPKQQNRNPGILQFSEIEFNQDILNTSETVQQFENLNTEMKKTIIKSAGKNSVNQSFRKTSLTGCSPQNNLNKNNNNNINDQIIMEENQTSIQYPQRGLDFPQQSPQKLDFTSKIQCEISNNKLLSQSALMLEGRKKQQSFPTKIVPDVQLIEKKQQKKSVDKSKRSLSRFQKGVQQKKKSSKKNLIQQQSNQQEIQDLQMDSEEDQEQQLQSNEKKETIVNQKQGQKKSVQKQNQLTNIVEQEQKQECLQSVEEEEESEQMKKKKEKIRQKYEFQLSRLQANLSKSDFLINIMSSEVYRADNVSNVLKSAFLPNDTENVENKKTYNLNIVETIKSLYK